MLQVNSKYVSNTFQDCYSKEDGLVLIIPGQIVNTKEITDKDMVIFTSEVYKGDLSLSVEKFKEIFRRLS